MVTFNHVPYSNNVLYIPGISIEQAREAIEKDSHISSCIDLTYNDYDFSREGFNEWLEKVMKGEQT